MRSAIKPVFFLRSLVGLLLFVPVTLFFSVLGIVVNLTLNNRKIDNWVTSRWAMSACFLFNIKIKLHDEHKIPPRGAVMLFNHSSFFDVFAIAALIPRVRFGAKIELFSIPVFGAAMRRMGVLPIARQNKENVFKVYEEAKERFKNRAQFVLSPEGGRFYGEELSKFKSGPFIFAISSQVDIVPLIVHGAYECLPKGSWLPNKDRWQRYIDVYVLGSISTQGLTIDERGTIQNQVYEMMNSQWISLTKSNPS